MCTGVSHIKKCVHPVYNKIESSPLFWNRGGCKKKKKSMDVKKQKQSIDVKKRKRSIDGLKKKKKNAYLLPS